MAQPQKIFKHMNHYIQELERIKKICFSNEEQLDVAIKTKRYIDHNFGEKINLEVLAQLQCTSKYHLIRIFKKYFGITPRQYLIKNLFGNLFFEAILSIIRLDKAKGYDFSHS